MNSLWKDIPNTCSFPKIEQNKMVDVCVIGAGITGINLAYMLQNRGLKVAILERDSVCNRSYSKYNW